MLRMMSKAIVEDHRDKMNNDFTLCEVTNEEDIDKQLDKLKHAHQSSSGCHEEEWAYDDTNNTPLDPKAVRKARMDEIEYCKRRDRCKSAAERVLGQDARPTCHGTVGRDERGR